MGRPEGSLGAPRELRLTRRRVLIAGGILSGAAVVAVTLPRLGQQPVEALLRHYPRRTIGRVRALAVDSPQEFFYPFEHPNTRNFLIKLGEPAGGGIGPERDIVAFNSLCPHQGGPLAGRYDAAHKVFGPCPLHLSTFDLTRHGMVVSGHATQGLPQILLELKGDDIEAVGVQALVYGFSNNLARPTAGVRP